MSESGFRINPWTTEWTLCASPAVAKTELALIEMRAPCLGTEA